MILIAIAIPVALVAMFLRTNTSTQSFKEILEDLARGAGHAMRN
jgi:hypothetical protein